MPERTPSKELTLPSAQLLCEVIIDQIGEDRGNGERPRFDADWEAKAADGEGQKLRLIQQGLGEQAVYTLRVSGEFSSPESIYRYDVVSGSVSQRAKTENGQLSTPYAWDEPVLHGMLWSGVSR